MKILVTGHRGYIGSHLLTDLESLEHDVVGIDLKEGDDVYIASQMRIMIMCFT